MTKEQIKKHGETMIAWANGAEIEYMDSASGNWLAASTPTWPKNFEYRVKPWTLSRSIAGFRELREGEQWHHRDFTQEDLEGGWRPLLDREVLVKDDECYAYGSGPWNPSLSGLRVGPFHSKHRTRRPLPEPKKMVQLEWSDINSTDVFRRIDWPESDFVSLKSRSALYVLIHTNGGNMYYYPELQTDWLRSTDGGKTFNRCEKEGV